MPRLREYRVFISHAWDYDEYHKIKEFLDVTANFVYRNYSVPYDNPLDIRNEIKLRKSLRQLVKMCQIVLIPAGMEINFRAFIQYELMIAQKFDKPIIGIIPRGAQRIPRLISDSASEIVGWNRKSIVDAIRRHAL
jgi:hypothetical protein